MRYFPFCLENWDRKIWPRYSSQTYSLQPLARAAVNLWHDQLFAICARENHEYMHYQPSQRTMKLLPYPVFARMRSVKPIRSQTETSCYSYLSIRVIKQTSTDKWKHSRSQRIGLASFNAALPGRMMKLLGLGLPPGVKICSQHFRLQHDVSCFLDLNIMWKLTHRHILEWGLCDTYMRTFENGSRFYIAYICESGTDG